MLTEERQEWILEKLNRENTVKIADLAKELECSLSTIRRDLSELEDKGLLARVHGGAKRMYTIRTEMEMKEKAAKNLPEKKQIGQLAASFVKPGDVLFLDAGTTTYEMIPFLKEIPELLAVTNGISHADWLTDYGISTILLGGTIKQKTKAVIGATALAQLKQYRFSQTFLGMNGIDKKFGYTTPDPEEAALKKLAGSLANQTYVLADATKFHQVNFAAVGALEDFFIVTDRLKDKDREPFKKETKIWEAEV